MARRAAARDASSGLVPAFAALVLLLAIPAPTFSAAGGQLEISVVDRDTGKPVACRMYLKAGGKPRKVEKSLYWHDHFVVPGSILLKLPAGQYTFEMERGPEYLNREGNFAIENNADDRKQVDLGRFIDMKKAGWWSGDLDVRRGPRDIELLMDAEDLHLAEVVTWWNDRSEWKGLAPPADGLKCFDKNRCCHLLARGWARSGTDLLLLHLPGAWKPPPAGPWIDPAALRAAREHDGFWADLATPFSWDLPLLVAFRQLDSIELAYGGIGRDGTAPSEGEGKPRDKQRFPGPSGNALWAEHVYYQLLECGLRIPPSAGSGSGVWPNPVGYNRVYVHVGDEFSYEQWWKNLRLGRVVVTNGPLMQPTVHGQYPGHVFQAEAGQKLDFEIGLTFSTRDPVTYLEIVKNGKVEHSVRFDDYAGTGKLPKVEFDRSGWFLVRAVTDRPRIYRFATTGPYYVEIGYERRIGKRATQFFLDWVYERARQIKTSDAPQRSEMLEQYRIARDFWQGLVEKANAE